ncbi:MAG: hypothetical protein AAGA64_03575 [Bacteroidota bacterium]
MQGLWLSKYRLFLCQEKFQPILLFGIDSQFYKLKGCLPDGSMLLDLGKKQGPYCNRIPDHIERSNNRVRRMNSLEQESAEQVELAIADARNIANTIVIVGPLILSNVSSILGPFGAILGKIMAIFVSQIPFQNQSYHNKLPFNNNRPVIEPDLKVIREIPLIKYKI